MIEFTKMHGLGNDFVVINAISQSISLLPDQVRQICDRHFGIGCDQLLLIEPPPSPDSDFCYRIFNADGGEVEQCGNGARCFARFVVDNHLTDKIDIRVQTASGPLMLHVHGSGDVTVNMGVPELEPDNIPFVASERGISYDLLVNSHKYAIGAVSIGNPHAVLRVEDVSKAPLEELGNAIESHERFPQHTNVGFMAVIDQQNIELRVFERGVGETLACGSGACAAAVIGQLNGWLGEHVRIHLPGGCLTTHWSGEGEPLYMKGPAKTVFKGRIEL